MISILTLIAVQADGCALNLGNNLFHVLLFCGEFYAVSLVHVFMC